MVVATAMRGVKALGARNQSCLQSGPWVESNMNPEAGFPWVSLDFVHVLKPIGWFW